MTIAHRVHRTYQKVIDMTAQDQDGMLLASLCIGEGLLDSSHDLLGTAQAFGFSNTDDFVAAVTRATSLLTKDTERSAIQNALGLGPNTHPTLTRRRTALLYPNMSPSNRTLIRNERIAATNLAKLIRQIRHNPELMATVGTPEERLAELERRLYTLFEDIAELKSIIASGKQ